MKKSSQEEDDITVVSMYKVIYKSTDILIENFVWSRWQYFKPPVFVLCSESLEISKSLEMMASFSSIFIRKCVAVWSLRKLNQLRIKTFDTNTLRGLYLIVIWKSIVQARRSKIRTMDWKNHSTIGNHTVEFERTLKWSLTVWLTAFGSVTSLYEHPL